ncbi:glycosyltransferase family 4 protein [Ruminiclostridium cellobioparum]|uniref:Glycosyltransferase n=1 Tax=Ruminiclostridium cellobioparum subsp. termitidis CT1112 TaxID=1195236 RepID=S0FNN1_RUMCE|nr:glycosyltransferase family 4 protein [Ruminiclostridium cellobioparum]EMS71971.1 Glycosyltransferase [Ruminiclostridium cellobioparum subsp. termitidis CT1112]
MRILVVNKFLFNRGGSETYIFKLFKRMKELGHEVEFFGMQDSRNIVGNSLGLCTRKLDFKGSVLKKGLYPLRIIYSVEAKKKIDKVIRNFRPNIVHLNNYNYQITPSILYSIRKYNLPVVQTLHDPQIVCPNHKLFNDMNNRTCEKCRDGKFLNCIVQKCIDNSLAKSAMGAAESFIYRKLRAYRLIDCFISPSNFLKDKISEMQAGLPADKIVVLHNFVDEKVGMAGGTKKPYVLYFGRIANEKGISTLAEACSRLPHIKFVFVGCGELEYKLAGIKNIEFLGFKQGEELKKYIKEALFSVCPSEWYENCPLSILESQMYGTPVIGARIGGIPELIDDGSDGLLFNPADAEDLAEKINYLYCNEELLQKFSSRCFDKIDKFSIDKYIDTLTGIYDMSIQTRVKRSVQAV